MKDGTPLSANTLCNEMEFFFAEPALGAHIILSRKSKWTVATETESRKNKQLGLTHFFSIVCSFFFFLCPFTFLLIIHCDLTYLSTWWKQTEASAITVNAKFQENLPWFKGSFNKWLLDCVGRSTFYFQLQFSFIDTHKKHICTVHVLWQPEDKNTLYWTRARKKHKRTTLNHVKSNYTHNSVYVFVHLVVVCVCLTVPHSFSAGHVSEALCQAQLLQ